MDVSAPPLQKIEPIERETMRRVAWRLMPLLVLGFFCACLDRSNVGMAAPTMIPDLGFSNAVFGFGAGLFFFGYFLAQVPSNLILDKVGARRWFARIMMTWGIIAGLTAFVWNDWSFYSMRFLLGLAEAGYYPGVVLYLTWWFPAHYRSRMIALFQSASPIATVIGSPVSGLLLQLDGALGLHGWQWLFLLEALPPIIICVLLWQLLTDRPADATWLRSEQKAWLVKWLESERAQLEAVRTFSLAEAFYNPKIWLMTVSYIGVAMVGYGLVFFMPVIVKGLGVSTGMIGPVTAVPDLCAFVAMNVWGWHSDVTGERTWHAAGPCLLTAAGLAACVVIGVGHPVVTMAALALAVVGLQSMQAPFWSLPSALLTGTAAAGGIALINSVGMLGGWLGPWVFGLVKDATGSDNIGLLCLALAPVISAVLLVLASYDSPGERIPVEGGGPSGA
jgi:MFS family permease